ncbi:ABC transporter ATP-binding protein [Candidatus Poribacteria bacterium]|nr:ABC transporter ATP-binding protein [Candidatus Poribacteria bacterium]
MGLELQNVTKRFGGLVAVNEVSLSVIPGRVTSLIGPNGAGKTTLFNLISGFLRPDAGAITLDEQRLDTHTPWQIAQMGVGRLWQDVRVFDRLSILENVLLAQHSSGENPLWALLRRPAVRKIEEVHIAAAEKWLNFVGLQEYRNTLAENLSYGQQKLLAMARLLAGDSRVLLLDEPTAGVNPVMVKPILGLIRQLAVEGRTVVVIEHNMTVVLEVSDWVYFLDDGQLVAFGRPDDVLGDRSVREAYLGI